MKIFPAIDLYGGKAVRLLHGDYAQMTVYGDPIATAREFVRQGAEWVHVVDLEGAKRGFPAHTETVKRIVRETSLRVQVGGGIRTAEAVSEYLSCGAARVIIGTAAVTDEGFLLAMLDKYGEKIAVGADVADGRIAIRGWQEKSEIGVDAFFERMQTLGVKTVICTDISKDGAMQGTNRALYRRLKETYRVDILASGGVSDLEDVKALTEMGLYGAIVGKAYYLGAIDLKKTIEVAR